MTDRKPWDRLREPTRRAAQRENQSAGPRGEERSPGDLLSFPETAATDVEWAVIEIDSGTAAPVVPGQAVQTPVVLVPVDLGAILGQHDVAVPAGAPSGACVLRCGFPIRMTRESAEGGRRTGRLPREAVEAAAKSWRSALAARLDGGRGSGGAPADLDLLDWLDEVVAPAATRLIAERPGAVAATLEPTAQPMTGSALKTPLADGSEGDSTQVTPESSSWRSLGRLAAGLAALLLAAFLLVSLSGNPLARDRSGQDPPDGDPAIRHPVVLALDPAAVTRGELAVEIPPEASHLLITWMAANGNASGPASPAPSSGTHRIEILTARGEEVWRSETLRTNRLGEVWAAAPTRLLPPGAYRLRVLRRLGEDEERVQESLFQIRRPGP